MPNRPAVLFAAFDAVPAPKGASVHILESVRALARFAEVDLITLPGTIATGSETASGAECPGVPPGVRHYPVVRPEENFLQRAVAFGDSVAERLVVHDYQVVHVRSIWEGTPARLLQPQRGYRLVYEVNGLPSIELRAHYSGLTGNRELLFRLRSQERALLHAASLVITQSQTTRRLLLTLGAPAARLRVIPNGVDADRFDVGTAPANDPPTLLYLGTLAPWQGLEFLVAALRLLAPEREFRARLVGSGRKEWRKSLEREIRRTGLDGRVELLPSVVPAEVPALLAAADICLAPLAVTERNVRQGCCPLKILEYMAAGRPIVAPRLPVVRELLTEGETALLYKPDRPRRLAEALTCLLDDPALRARLGAAARQEVCARLTWEHHHQALIHAYDGMLEKRQSEEV